MGRPIALRALRKEFGQTVAVDDVDLDIDPGDLFFLLGPSGCGKTTLLRMIAGFTDPTAGTIHFGDDDVTNLPANRRNCGMVFQGYALWPHMTVRQNVAFGLGVRKVSARDQQRRTDAVLETVQLSQYADRKPNELSGGQQQRVALARALVIEPTVLLLDEPLSNLDAKLRIGMRSQIKRICKDAGITAVYVTHDQKEALSMADGIALLKDGKIAQVDAPRDLYERPVNRFVADFLGETNFIPAVVLEHNGEHIILETAAGRLRSSVVTPDLPDRGNVTCSIRPEAVRLLNPNRAVPHGLLNRFDARRTDVMYLGEMAQHDLVIAGKVALRAFELNPGPINSSSDTLSVGFSPGDVVILRD